MSDEKDKVTEDSEETKSTEESAEESDAETSEGSESEAAESSDASEEEKDSSDAVASEASDDEDADDDAEEDDDADEEASDDSSDAEEDDAEEEDSDSDDADEDSDASDAEEEDAEDSDASEPEESDESDESEPSDDDHGHDDHGHDDHDHGDSDPSVAGVAAIFDHPDHLMYAATQARDSEYEAFDAFSPFPIHGMDDAMGLGRSWIPWVTFLAGAAGFSFANFMEFGIMWYDWPMVFGGRPYAAWPSFVPIMFELTVLLAGHTTAFVMLYAAGCFRKPLIIDPEITNDRFVLYISATDEHFNRDAVVEFMKDLNPMEIRTVRKEGKS